MENAMFCYQCEQTMGSKGCTKVGVCGKSADIANLQDVLIFTLKGIAYYGYKAINDGIKIPQEINRFVKDALFSTLTNVNFDEERFVNYINEAAEVRNKIKILSGNDDKNAPVAAVYEIPRTKEGMLKVSETIGVMSDEQLDMDIRSLRELLIYGMKGMAAYSHHAEVLGKIDEEVDNFFYKGLALVCDDTLTVDDLFNLNMEFGRVNLKCMSLLDEANTSAYGNPEPTEVTITKKKGPFIIVSGHDLHDLKLILERTEGTGINIYTHGEMLPSHGYPELKKYKHLVGNYGGAWQDQQEEFDNLPGCILMTTNCIMKPRESYKDRIFSTSIVGYEGIQHIKGKDDMKDFTSIIEKAIELGGFKEDEIEQKIVVGFGHHATLSHADEIVQAVNKGEIRHFFIIGGCDGARPGRNYYTEFAEQTPKDTIMLTLACGKYRFNKKDFGNIAGLPRLLDCGQCNDSYSAIKIALALAEAFNCTVNELPLSLILSWYEQKAVCILITLLSLGIRNIYLGPTLPAFITPNVLQLLVDKFNITPISTPEKDLEAIL